MGSAFASLISGARIWSPRLPSCPHCSLVARTQIMSLTSTFFSDFPLPLWWMAWKALRLPDFHLNLCPTSCFLPATVFPSRSAVLHFYESSFHQWACITGKLALMASAHAHIKMPQAGGGTISGGNHVLVHGLTAFHLYLADYPRVGLGCSPLWRLPEPPALTFLNKASLTLCILCPPNSVRCSCLYLLLPQNCPTPEGRAQVLFSIAPSVCGSVTDLCLMEYLTFNNWQQYSLEFIKWVLVTINI